MQLKTYQDKSLDALKEYFQAVEKEGDANVAFYKETAKHWGKNLPYYEVAELPGLPYVCLRIPTGGGKTVMACHAAGITTKEYLKVDRSIILWLAPSTTIRDQTLKNLKNRKHFYRQALESKLGSVTVLDIQEAKNLQPAVINSDTVIIVSTNQAFRVEDPELRKVYEASGALMGHFDNVPSSADIDRYENGRPIPSLGNLLRLHRPIVIVDEAHNVRSEISFQTLARFNPSCILEFTATPKTEGYPSNVLCSVSARELKAEDMIKMPIRLEVRPQWKELIGDAKTTLDGLQIIAEKERAETGEYIRPIMLIQAQPRRQNQQTLTVDVVEACLKDDYQIPAEQIARATGDDDQIGEDDLTSPDSKIRYIITVQKLREGWDCPFAYVLCSVAEQYSTTAVEQIIGRILRMPKATKKLAPELNMAYAFVSSPNFERTLNSLKDALVENGFQKQDADEMVVHAPQKDFGPWFDQKALGGETVVFKFDEAPELHKLPFELAKKVKYDTASKTISIESTVTEQELEKISETFKVKEQRAAFQVAVKNAQAKLNVPALTPAERGERFAVPVLAIKQGNLFEQFEDTHFLDFDWELAKQDVNLSEAEFSTDRPAPQQGEVDVNEKGEVKTKFLDRLKDQMVLLRVDLGWKVSNLTTWLDRNIYHPDIPASDTGVFLTRLINTLIEKRGIPLDALVKEKYRLRDAVTKKIDEHRKKARKNSFDSFFKKDSRLEVSPSKVFEFNPDEYPCPVNSLHRGSHQFQNHYYKDIGDLKSTGEEFECAQFIDNMPEVEFWVRNLPKQDKFSFWLQTSTDRFYPDFVCKLKDGRILVVEYKGSDRIDNPEEQEKLEIGEFWEQHSEGRCLFVMPTRRQFEVIRAKVK
jgi:type III restriction enzyme